LPLPLIGRHFDISHSHAGIWFDAKAQKFKLLMHQYHSSMSLVGGYAESKVALKYFVHFHRMVSFF
jgi:hypothetical protein